MLISDRSQKMEGTSKPVGTTIQRNLYAMRFVGETSGLCSPVLVLRMFYVHDGMRLVITEPELGFLPHARYQLNTKFEHR